MEGTIGAHWEMLSKDLQESRCQWVPTNARSKDMHQGKAAQARCCKELSAYRLGLTCCTAGTRAVAGTAATWHWYGKDALRTLQNWLNLPDWALTHFTNHFINFRSNGWKFSTGTSFMCDRHAHTYIIYIKARVCNWILKQKTFEGC